MISENLQRVRDTLPEGVTLVAVSKFHPAEAVREAYDAGQRDFGESRAQELAAKAPALPADIRWHFIGHLQTNKVRQVLPHVALIQSVDSIKLLREIDKEARRIGRTVDVLLEVHVAQEETKSGFAPDELFEAVTPELLNSLECVRVVGVMGMASLTDDTSRIAADFDAIRGVFETLRDGVMAARGHFTLLSMGMSDDYLVAVSHGSDMVRIGTDIFGPREY